MAIHGHRIVRSRFELALASYVTTCDIRKQGKGNLWDSTNSVFFWKTQRRNKEEVSGRIYLQGSNVNRSFKTPVVCCVINFFICTEIITARGWWAANIIIVGNASPSAAGSLYSRLTLLSRLCCITRHSHEYPIEWIHDANRLLRFPRNAIGHAAHVCSQPLRVFGYKHVQ